jgi:ligand-binding sensor domain-containing protein
VLAQHRQEYIFTNYSTSNGGLATNLINSMAQESKGHMWLATYNGLQRFDGNKFMTFRNVPDDNTSIPTNNIQTLFFDKNNRLWLAGNNNQVGFFNTTHFTFQETPVQNKKKEIGYVPKHFFISHDSKLMLYEEKGELYSYNEKAGQFILENNFIKLPSGWKQNQITWDRFINKYWIASDSGLVLYNPANKQISYRGHNTENDPVIKRFENATDIITLLVSSNNSVSFYTKRYPLYLLYHYNRKTGSAIIEHPGKKLGLNFHEIHGLSHQRNGRIWVHGVKIFAEWIPNQNLLLPVSSYYNAEYKIKSNYVNLIFEDRENNLWVATDNGIFVFNPEAQLFNAYQLKHPILKNNEEEPVLTMSMMQTKEGTTYIGTWQAGLFLFDKNFRPLALPEALKTLRKDLTVWSMHEHEPTGNIWFVTEKEGRRPFVYRPKSNTVQWVEDNLIKGSNIQDMIEDNNGNLWIGTREGQLIKWNYHLANGDINKGFELFTKQPGAIRRLYKDSKGYLWVVTNKGGLLKVDPRKHNIVKNYAKITTKGYQLMGNDFFDVLQYNDTTLIVAADANLNLINLRTNRVTHITTTDGLPANTIRSIQKDRKGIIWLGLLGGICRVNLEKKIFTIYDRKDGIPYDNFGTGGALLLHNGQLLFSTYENLLVIDPTRAVHTEKPAHPILTSFHLASKPLKIDSILREDVKLNYDNSSISIGFNNLSFLKQRTTRYYYKLEGLDKDWVLADASKQAQYNYIQPGSYTFYVKSVNEDGISSTASAPLRIVVKPPFWKTGLFYAILTLLGLLVLFLIDKERVKRLRMVQQMRSQIAGDLHKDIHMTLNDISVLSAMAKMKADKDIDRSKDYIDTISVKSRDMMESMGDILWALDPENDSMEKMLLRIQEYTEAIRNTQKAVIELNSSQSVRDVLLDMRCRHEFLLFYKHALNFVIQKTHYPTIYINIEYVKGKLALHFDGKSTELLEENMNSLFSQDEMNKRAEVLNADLQIVAEKQQLIILLQLNA